MSSGTKGRARLTLRPGDPGTKAHLERFGADLVAVRYRYDDTAMRRYTMVELVVDNRPWVPQRDAPDPARLVGVQIRYGEEALRRDVRAAGATWDAEEQLWWIKLGEARRLGLEQRIVKWTRRTAGISSTR